MPGEAALLTGYLTRASAALWIAAARILVGGEERDVRKWIEETSAGHVGGRERALRRVPARFPALRRLHPQCRRSRGSMNLPALGVVVGVGHHVQAVRHPVGVVEERRHIADVEDVLVGETHVAQGLPVSLGDVVGR